jgi:anti-anti-sigma regulatory factor
VSSRETGAASVVIIVLTCVDVLGSAGLGTLVDIARTAAQRARAAAPGRRPTVRPSACDSVLALYRTTADANSG